MSYMMWAVGTAWRSLEFPQTEVRFDRKLSTFFYHKKVFQTLSRCNDSMTKKQERKEEKHHIFFPSLTVSLKKHAPSPWAISSKASLTLSSLLPFNVPLWRWCSPGVLTGCWHSVLEHLPASRAMSKIDLYSDKSPSLRCPLTTTEDRLIQRGYTFQGSPFCKITMMTRQLNAMTDLHGRRKWGYMWYMQSVRYKAFRTSC